MAFLVVTDMDPLADGNDTKLPRLGSAFRDAVATQKSADIKSKDIETENKELAALMGQPEECDGYGLPGGLLSRYGYLEKKDRRKKRKKDQWFMDMMLAMALRDAIKQLEQIIAYHQKQIERLIEEIKQNRDKLLELDRRAKALQEILERYQKEGAFGLDENGRLANEAAEAALRSFEQKSGCSVDRSGPGLYAALLEAALLNEQEREQTSMDIKKGTERYKYHKAQKEKAESIRRGLESDDPEKRSEALREMEGIGAYAQHDIAYHVKKSGNDINEVGATGALGENHGYEGFSFGFPSLKNEFEGASAGKKKNSLATDGQPINAVGCLTGPKL